MFTVRYADKSEYGAACYVVVDPNGNDHSKFSSGVDAENKAAHYNKLQAEMLGEMFGEFLLHTCPYAQEMDGDCDTLCDCDEEQTYQCIQDI
jgi:hypothetical protein